MIGLVVKVGSKEIGDDKRRACIKVYNESAEVAEFWISAEEPKIGDKFDITITPQKEVKIS